jgi:hypothetical protein
MSDEEKKQKWVDAALLVKLETRVKRNARECNFDEL